MGFCMEIKFWGCGFSAKGVELRVKSSRVDGLGDLSLNPDMTASVHIDNVNLPLSRPGSPETPAPCALNPEPFNHPP
jgi:hypothetical protein